MAPMAQRGLFALLLFAGCTGTAVPQPPNLVPVEPDRLEPEFPEATGFEITGGAGAAPGGVEVWAWDLEASGPPAVAMSDAQGRFTLSLPSEPPGELRLQARLGADRSPPLDVVRVDTRYVEVDRPDCLEIPRELDLGRARAGDLVIDNACGEAVELVAVTSRGGVAELTVDAPDRASLPDGARLELPARAAGAATVEDIVFVAVRVRGSPARYPVTVIARGP